MSKTQKILIIAGVVVFVFIGIIGLALAGDKKKPTTSNKQTTSSSSQTSSSSNGGVSQRHSPNEALSLVRSTYLKASAYIARNTTPDQGEIDAVKSYLSNDLYTALTNTLLTNQAAGDQIICSDQGANSGYDLSLVSALGNIATINVNEHFATPVTVTYSVDLTTLQITNIACPVQ
jgi:cytoskeletal protein RodZ